MKTLLIIYYIVFCIFIREYTTKFGKKIFILYKLRKSSHCYGNLIQSCETNVFFTVFQCYGTTTSTLPNHLNIIGEIEDAGLLKI
ncbi:MAG: hypothetical protein MJZ70_02725 [Bacteroidales bacterium]|nr:hypothetical protein [Bacteroidales bacterium]